MFFHNEIDGKKLRQKIRDKSICLGGNKKLKIYGTLKCKSGKRMKRQNRVFFSSIKEVIDEGYRPCGHCMKSEYKKWICSENQ